MEKIKDCSLPYMNFTAFSPTHAIIGGKYGTWSINSEIIKGDTSKVESFWDVDKNELKLGNFKHMVNFFIEICGKKERIEKEVGTKND